MGRRAPGFGRAGAPGGGGRGGADGEGGGARPGDGAGRRAADRRTTGTRRDPGAGVGVGDRAGPDRQAGFTLVELLLVLAIVGLLAAIAVPSVQGAITRAEEAALRENLSVMRRALDDHFADTGAYPETLETLVDRRYLRFVPDDPVAPEGAGWGTVEGDDGGVADVRSTSAEPGTDGRPYAEW